MERDMAFINDLVRQVREQSGLTLEQVAASADFAVSTINRYEAGEREVSLRYFRTLFHMTGDRRLLHYFSPGVAELICMPSAQVEREASRSRTAASRQAPTGDPKDLLARELVALGQLTKAAQYIEQIVADGLVDQSDHQAVLNLQRKHDEVRSIMDAADRALVAWLEATTRKN